MGRWIPETTVINRAPLDARHPAQPSSRLTHEQLRRVVNYRLLDPLRAADMVGSAGVLDGRLRGLLEAS